METVKENRKIADMFNPLALQGMIKVSVILTPSYKGCIELWQKKSPNFKKKNQMIVDALNFLPYKVHLERALESVKNL